MAQKQMPVSNKKHSQSTRKSESLNILMYAPSEGQHDILFRLLMPTGSISGSISGVSFESKYSGLLSNLEYAYGLNDSWSVGLTQSLFNDYMISSNSSDSKYSGVGDTSLTTKYILPIDNLNLYMSGQYKMALLAKSKNNYDSNEYTIASDRNKLTLDVGLDFKMDMISMGGQLTYDSYQVGESEKIDSGISTTDTIGSGGGHSLAFYSQLNLDMMKIGLTLSESVTYEYSSKSSTGLSTTTYLASTYRQLMLSSIVPVADNFEGLVSVIKYFPKEDDSGLSYNYFILMAGLRATF